MYKNCKMVSKNKNKIQYDVSEYMNIWMPWYATFHGILKAIYDDDDEYICIWIIIYDTLLTSIKKVNRNVM